MTTTGAGEVGFAVSDGALPRDVTDAVQVLADGGSFLSVDFVLSDVDA